MAEHQLLISIDSIKPINFVKIENSFLLSIIYCALKCSDLVFLRLPVYYVYLLLGYFFTTSIRIFPSVNYLQYKDFYISFLLVGISSKNKARQCCSHSGEQ